MTRRLLIVGIELLVALVVIVTAALFWASYYVDTQEFRTRFTSTLRNAIGREVQLNGDININLWPDILLEVGDLSVGEDPEFGDEPFARFETIHINIQVLPLLAKKVMVESVYVDGLDVTVVSDKQGRFNLESLGNAGGESVAAPVDNLVFSLANIEVENTRVRFEDRAVDRQWRLSGISLRTGQIKADVPVPVTVGSAFTWDEHGIKSDLTLKGLVRFNQDLTDIHLDDAMVTASAYGKFLPEGVEPGQLTAQVSIDWDNRIVALEAVQAQFMGLRAEGDIQSADLSKELSAHGHVTVQPFNPSGMIGRFVPELPLKSVDGLKSSALATFFRIDEEGVRFEELVAALDDITVRGDLGFTGYQKPVFDFAVWTNTIDLDRYLPLFKTDTPFIWDDFNLPLFRAFKGAGTIRADGLNILDTLLSDIRLKVAADKAIVIDAGAIKKGQASLGGTVEVVIGAEGKDNVPTLSMTARINAESQRDGFAFLQGNDAWLSGVGTIEIDGAVSTMSCPPKARSMEIADHVNADVTLALYSGGVGFKQEAGERRELIFTESELKANVSPASGPEMHWNTLLSASFAAQGGSEISALSVDFQGPLSVAWDEDSVGTVGMSVNATASVDALPEGAQRVNASARVAYASDVKSVEIADAFLSVLETSLTGSGTAVWHDDMTKGTGEVAIVGADPKRLIKLLTGEEFETDDPEALRNWSMQSRFEADENGFILRDATADIDGFKVAGHVVSNGYVNPMLSFSLTGGELDIDRYLPPSQELTLEEKRSGRYVKAPPVRLPMEFLGALRLNGKVALDELKLAKIRARKVTGDIRTDNGQIQVSQIVGTAYDGSLIADWSGEIHKDFLTTHLQLHVEDMQAGPFMKDVGGKDYVRGLTDVDLDVNSRGATDDDILKNLNGKSWARITNGSFKFSGHPKEGGHAPATQSKQDAEREAKRARSRTPFTKAVGHFSAENGVFTADKFRVESPPMLQSYGEGSFSLPDNSIDLAIRNDFVAVPSVTLHLEGRLTDPEVNIPTGKIVNDTVFNILSLPLKPFKFLRDLF